MSSAAQCVDSKLTDIVYDRLETRSSIVKHEFDGN